MKSLQLALGQDSLNFLRPGSNYLGSPPTWLACTASAETRAGRPNLPEGLCLCRSRFGYTNHTMLLPLSFALCKTQKDHSLETIHLACPIHPLATQKFCRARRATDEEHREDLQSPTDSSAAPRASGSERCAGKTLGNMSMERNPLRDPTSFVWLC